MLKHFDKLCLGLWLLEWIATNDLKHCHICTWLGQQLLPLLHKKCKKDDDGTMPQEDDNRKN